MLQVDKRTRFQMLVEDVERCDLCERMFGRHKILSDKNGSTDAMVLFVGEAPGRLGADRTQVPFRGDQAGKNFERLLGAAGLRREEVFVTNAVLCNPRDERGNNATPSPSELWNCSLYLDLLLAVVRPQIVVTLGLSALRALNAIEKHSIALRNDVRRPVKWMSYTVLPLYHPGPRATIHRSLQNQFADFYCLGEIMGRQRQVRRRRTDAQLPLFESFSPSLAHQIVFAFVKRLGEVSKFRLTKLLYFLDWQEVQATGSVFTGFYYIFQKNGPLATGVSQILDEMDGHELACHFRGREPVYTLGGDSRHEMTLPREVSARVDELVDRYGNVTDSEIKTKAYLTDPVKTILRRQRRGENVFNSPVFEGWLQTGIKRHGTGSADQDPGERGHRAE